MNAHDEWQRRVGLALGYPSCCVEAFVADNRLGVMSAVQRGSISRGPRSNVAEAALATGIDPAYLSEILYVPCRTCMGGVDWQPFSLAVAA